MGRFKYKAEGDGGRIHEGLMEAPSEDAVAFRLEKMGLRPVSVLPDSDGGGDLPFWRRVFGRVRPSERNMFTRQLFTMQKAGLPIVRSLEALREQSGNPIFVRVLDDLIRDIQAGASLSEALEKHPKVFDPLYTSMVRSGEVSGRLAEILDRLALLGEQEERTRNRIKAALRYPAIVVVAIVLGFIILVTLVVPRFASLFADFEATLPLPTRILLAINDAVRHYWWFWILVGLGLGLLVRRHLAGERGRRQWDAFSLKLPVFGPLRLKLILSRFCRLTAVLLKSGVPIMQVLELVAESLGNSVVAETVMRIRASVNDGNGMSGPIKESGLFPPVVVQMVAVGEETGRLDDLLQHVAGYYDQETDYTISNLVSLIEPMLIFVLGLAVLFMALGIFLPMWDMMSLFRK